MPEFRAARFADAVSLAPRLRFADAREIAASWGVGAEEGLFLCLLHSRQAFTLILDGEPEALWGVCAAGESGLDIGVPWMLAGERTFDRNRGVLAQTRRVVRHLLLDYDVLANLTDAENAAHLRWLGWCGFRPLRRHARYGAAGRPFIEFYQINERRGLAEEAVRAVLEYRRLPAPAFSADAPVRRMARAGISLLDPGSATRSVPDELTLLLQDLGDATSSSVNVRRNWMNLMLECAVAVTAKPGRGLPTRHTLLRELMDALSDVADLLVLEGRAGDGGLVLGMAPPPAPRAPRPTQPGHARAVQPVHRRGPEPASETLQWLLRRYVRLLTLDGRVSRIHGWRFWAASLCVSSDETRRQAWADRRDVLQPMADHLLAELPECRLDSCHLRARARRSLLRQSVEHGAAMAALRAACGRWPRLGAAVKAEVDRWVVWRAAQSEAESERTGIGSVGEALKACSAIAERAALALLPEVRFGAVVAGYADRHWLYRLLRMQLLEAAAGAAGIEGEELRLLLVDDVDGVLLAGRLEARLLAAGDVEPDMSEVANLLGDSAAPWLAAPEAREALGYLTELLVPPLAVPSAHLVQLEPAAVTWRLAAAGALAQTLDGVDDLLGQVPTSSRLRYRKFLRSSIRDADRVSPERRPDSRIDERPLQRAER